MNTDGSQILQPWLSPRSILRALWKQKLYVVLTAVVVSGATFGIVQSLPAIYRTEALVLVISQKIPEKYVSSTVNTDVQDRLATISQRLLSSTKLKTMIDAFGLYKKEQKTRAPEEIIEMMRSDIHVTLERVWTGNRPGAFRVSYEGPDPNIVAEVTNRVANIFVEENLKDREEQAAGTSEFIANQLKEAKKGLEDLETRVSKFKVEHNGELPDQQAMISATLSRLQVELQGVQEAINRAQQNKVLLESTLSEAESSQSVLARSLQPPETNNDTGERPADKPAPLRSTLLEAQLERLRTRYNDDFPDVKRLRLEIAKARELEGKAVANSGAGSQNPQRTVAAKWTPSPEAAREVLKARERVMSVRAQLKLANQELEARTAEQQGIRSLIAEYQRRLERVPLREQEMQGLTRDYEISKANYKSLLDKRIGADMAADMENRQKAEIFRVIDQAPVPEKPAKPNRPVLETIGCLGGLLLGMVVAFGKELRGNILLGEWEIPGPVVTLAHIPYIQIPASGPNTSGQARGRWWVWAIISSALVSILGLIAASVHFSWIRF